MGELLVLFEFESGDHTCNAYVINKQNTRENVLVYKDFVIDIDGNRERKLGDMIKQIIDDPVKIQDFKKFQKQFGIVQNGDWIFDQLIHGIDEIKRRILANDLRYVKRNFPRFENINFVNEMIELIWSKKFEMFDLVYTMTNVKGYYGLMHDSVNDNHFYPIIKYFDPVYSKKVYESYEEYEQLVAHIFEYAIKYQNLEVVKLVLENTTYRPPQQNAVFWSNYEPETKTNEELFMYLIQNNYYIPSENALVSAIYNDEEEIIIKTLLTFTSVKVHFKDSDLPNDEKEYVDNWINSEDEKAEIVRKHLAKYPTPEIRKNNLPLDSKIKELEEELSQVLDVYNKTNDEYSKIAMSIVVQNLRRDVRILESRKI